MVTAPLGWATSLPHRFVFAGPDALSLEGLPACDRRIIRQIVEERRRLHWQGAAVYLQSRASTILSDKRLAPAVSWTK